MLGRFSISELYQIMAQVELSKRSTTISSRLVSQYKGRVTSINQGPKSPYYPRVKFTLTEGNDKYFVTYSKEELPNTTIMKKGPKMRCKVHLKNFKSETQFQLMSNMM